MADCSGIGLLLGPFEDGELEPHEMQEVARHLAQCPECEATLTDYHTLGRSLRDAAWQSLPDGFAQAVQARIARARVPIWMRTKGFIGLLGQRVAMGLAFGATAAAVAVVTAIIITPYAQRFVRRNAPPAQLASVKQEPKVASKAVGAELAAAGRDSSAVISRLEAQSPAVAVWSEPRTDTTVIWLPDQR
jgi:anti-sigma factor RsiW